MSDKFIMASQMLAIIEENKRNRLLMRMGRYDAKVIATVEDILAKMALGENREYDISLIWAENNENFREQFKDLTYKFGYTMVHYIDTPNQRFLSAFFTRE
ncbi:TPA: hypothetical protein DCZ36_00130 [Candidatus Gracilibacteria bacterium]|nr:hypothetical protein [Candidatus Gracilibacteria bacterium]